jgi:citrate lyase subunit beta/citryl-CoA lyase
MPATAPPRRSALYMPASNLRAMEKARDLPCDVVILDLEDAVAPDAKAVARAQALATLQTGGFGQREMVVRVNDLLSPWGADDLTALRGAGAAAVLLPKIAAAADIAAYRGILGDRCALWVMIETCGAIMNLRNIADVAPSYGVAAWVIGTNDLAREIRCHLDAGRSAIMPALSLAVIAARSQNIAILDGVFNDLKDEAGFARQCAQGKEYGFDGKTLIHPKQIDAANRAFSPTAEEIAWAREIIAAFAAPENEVKGALRLQGRMVERLHLAEAEACLRRARALPLHPAGG